jgi:hypothetical protein
MCRERYSADLSNLRDYLKEFDQTFLFVHFEANQALCLLKQV